MHFVRILQALALILTTGNCSIHTYYTYFLSCLSYQRTERGEDSTNCRQSFSAGGLCLYASEIGGNKRATHACNVLFVRHLHALVTCSVPHVLWEMSYSLRFCQPVTTISE